jgi:tRNA(Phe) wybutosine-synthesizing methylase Tyw3
MCALLNDSTYKLIILPAAAFQAGQRQNNEVLSANNDDNYNVNIVSDTSSDNLLQEESNAIFLQEKYAEVAVNRRKFEYDR